MAGMFIVIGPTCLVWEPLHTVLAIVPTEHPRIFGPLSRITAFAVLEPFVTSTCEDDVGSLDTLPTPIQEVLECPADGFAGGDLCPKFPPALRGVLGVKSLALGRHFVHRLSLQEFHWRQVA